MQKKETNTYRFGVQHRKNKRKIVFQLDCQNSKHLVLLYLEKRKLIMRILIDLQYLWENELINFIVWEA